MSWWCERCNTKNEKHDARCLFCQLPRPPAEGRKPGRPRKGAVGPSLEERTRLCERCGDAYAKPANQPWARWQNRRFCSHACWWDVRGNWNRYAGAK